MFVQKICPDMYRESGKPILIGKLICHLWSLCVLPTWLTFKLTETDNCRLLSLFTVFCIGAGRFTGMCTPMFTWTSALCGCIQQGLANTWQFVSKHAPVQGFLQDFVRPYSKCTFGPPVDHNIGIFATWNICKFGTWPWAIRVRETFTYFWIVDFQSFQMVVSDWKSDHFQENYTYLCNFSMDHGLYGLFTCMKCSREIGEIREHFMHATISCSTVWQKVMVEGSKEGSSAGTWFGFL